jgi:hypothetical protein
LGVHARSWFIEEQQLWLGRKRPCHLKPPLHAIREVARTFVGEAIKANQLEQIHRARVRLGFLAALGWQAQERSDR